MKAQSFTLADWERLAFESSFDPVVIASHCSISLRQLERIFKAHFQMTPKRWTCQLRCRKAAELVCRGWSTKAVAWELKFGNESHLCHEFKRVVGMSPQSFASAQRKSGCAKQESRNSTISFPRVHREDERDWRP